MAKKIVKTDFKLNTINQLIESITEPANTTYYMFVSRHNVYDDGDSNIPDATDNESTTIDLYREMVFGKRLSNNDMITMIPRHDWESGKYYTQYDDKDSSLFTKEFYAIVNASSTYHVYKCLYNNGNTASTIEPDFSAVDPEDEYYETSDGFIWKYMYSANSMIVDKFATDDYFPVVSNTTVESNAVEGAIDIIKVIGTGNNFNNYVAGNNYFTTSGIAIGGNTLLYDISVNSTASSSNDYYNGCYIYVVADSNTQSIGLYRKIDDYIVTNEYKGIVLSNSFPTNAISTSTRWEIYPGVNINGDGAQTINAEARAIVNAAGNTIYKIDMLNRGADYQFATAEVFTYSSVGATNAVLQVIKSPHFGHGSNAALELGSRSLGVSISFSNTESNTIPVTNDYRTVGILKDPVFSNASIQIQSSSGSFITNEKVFKINPILCGVTANLDSSNSIVTATASDFENQFSANDKIYFTDGSNYMLATVNSVTNSSYLELTTNATFTSSNASFYIANTSSFANVTSSNTTYLVLNNINGIISTNDVLIGSNSGAYMVANNISRSGINKNFNTFVNMYKYRGTVVAGSFIDDETIYQDDIETSNSILHSIVTSGSNTDLYTTNKFGTYQVPGQIIGNSSDAIFNATQEYEPELSFRSGDILFYENISPVNREETQSETIKFIFDF